MTEFLSIINEADGSALELENAKNKLEQAKLALETAKQELEQAKENFENVLHKAEALGIPKNKMKKIVEERIQSFIESGLMNSFTTLVGAEKVKAKTTKSTKNPKNRSTEVSDFNDGPQVNNEIETSNENDLSEMLMDTSQSKEVAKTLN